MHITGAWVECLRNRAREQVYSFNPLFLSLYRPGPISNLLTHGAYLFTLGVQVHAVNV